MKKLLFIHLGYEKIVEVLINKGIKVSSVMKEGYPALHWAIKNSNY